MKKFLSLLLSIVMFIVATSFNCLYSYAIGSEYWFTPTSENYELYFKDNKIRFSLNDTYIFNWNREQNYVLESVLKPEEIKEAKKLFNENIYYDSYFTYDDYDNSVEVQANPYRKTIDSFLEVFLNDISKRIGLNSDISDVEKIYRAFTYVFMSNHYSLYTDYFDELSLFYHDGYCQNFSLAFKDLCQKAGIECYIVVSDKLGHAWNEVVIDGKRYVIDCTFGDESFMITPQDFNLLWEKKVYIGSGTSYKTDLGYHSTDYSNSIYDFKKCISNKNKYWSSASDYSSEPSVIKVCNGNNMITWQNDNKADYYLIKRTVYLKNNIIDEDYLKYVFPDTGKTTTYVDDSAGQFSKYEFRYQVIKERFDCITDVIGNKKYTKVSNTDYANSNHIWALSMVVKNPTDSNLGASVYTCSICKTKMMAYTSNNICTQHNVIPVISEAKLNCTKDITCVNKCSKCNAVLSSYNIKAKGHNVVIDKAVKPTYKKAGKTQGSHCSICGQIIVAQKKLQKLTVPKIVLNTVKSKKPKQITVSWKKNTKVTGYEIQYSTSSKFKSAKTVKTTKNSIVSKTISKLKGKKKYYVRIRAYKKADGEKFYSAWSETKVVTTKK